VSRQQINNVHFPSNVSNQRSRRYQQQTSPKQSTAEHVLVLWFTTTVHRHWSCGLYQQLSNN